MQNEFIPQDASLDEGEDMSAYFEQPASEERKSPGRKKADVKYVPMVIRQDQLLQVKKIKLERELEGECMSIRQIVDELIEAGLKQQKNR